jgi:signal transduction histidine kinase
VKVISTNDNEWLSELSGKSRQPDSVYAKGGMIGLYEAEDGLHLGALSPVMSGDGEVVGMLQVEESFDSFMSKAQGQIYTNLVITLIFVIVIGILMFLSVKNILKRQEKLAEEKLELENFRRELLANISHDLRTPLAGIHGYIETLLMKKDSLDEVTREKYLITTLQGTAKLKTLVDELFELSKLESKEITIHIEPFHIQDLVHDIANQFKLSASEKGVEICVESPEQLPLVKADLALIDRVLHNLLSNALKYCYKGDKVTIGVREIAGKMHISVTDTGSGIAAEDLPHLFDRFYKGRSSQPGTGLGLAIVKNILVLHDSQYQVQSVLGEGTQFTFSLNI